MESPFDAYVGSKGSVILYEKPDTNDKIKHLLWGDGVIFSGTPDQNGRRSVKARGASGWVDIAALEHGEPLLEVYFIDVGQGDCVLIRTPDFRHLLVDGGYPRSQQPTGKSGADFVDWKFFRDYGSEEIFLDAIISSHNDHDHYGGLDDLLDISQNNQLECKGVKVDNFFHSGLSWWKDADGKRTLGTTRQADADGKEYFVDLLEDRPSAIRFCDTTQTPHLQGAWGAFVQKVLQTQTRKGTPTPFQRISQHTGTLPGFDGTTDSVSIKVLGPIEHDVNGSPGLKKLGSPSQSTNGQSSLLRLDYGNARILVTGDLNKAAQQDLLKQYAGREEVFACDVAKSCHHGSEDVSLEFMYAMKPSATVISSGDEEGHDHPRPRIVAASGVTGHVTFKNDELLTPLVYSTEIARSLKLGKVGSLSLADGSVIDQAALDQVRAHYKIHAPGSLRPKPGSMRMDGCFVVAGVVYGLVNVRTDGHTILCATLNEGDQSWTIKTFTTKFA
jgi:beta-lactamase superfamily II metal-dependent hydrolase